MLHITYYPDRRIFEVTCSGPLDEADFVKLRERIDPVIDDGEPFSGILINGPSFPGYADFKGFLEHLRFVREHHELIPKIAFLVDGAWADTFPTLVNDFVETEVRRFEPIERESAEQWLREPK